MTLLNVRKSYRSTATGAPITALDGLTLDVRRGEIFGLLGPNGAGKTTTVSIVVGLMPADEGSVTIADRGRPTDPAVRHAIGVAPQALALYELLSAEENLRFIGELYGLHGTALTSRTRWALDFVGLADRRGDRVSGFSGGMKRRLNLAAALVHDPDLVLLDEPTVGVDPQSRNHIFENIVELKRRGCTVIYTTHYMEEAERLCDRVAIIDRGRVLALGTVPELLEQHGAPPRTVVQRGTLEEVFLNLTGRNWRD